MQQALYQRRRRKLVHMIGGLFAFLLPVIPYWIALGGGLAALLGACWLKPSLAPWLYDISKPADRASGRISGLRGYAAAILILLLAWGLVSRQVPEAVRYVMFGWMALAFGDGLAGFIGPGPQVAATVPWNRHKTWWGVVGSLLGISLAYILCFDLPLTMAAGEPLARTLVLLPGVAVVGALIESLDLPVDDNYVVGLTLPVLAWLAHLLPK